MPRVPLYSGPIASAVLPHSFSPRDTGLFAQDRPGSVGRDTGQLLRRIFVGPEANPQAELAKKYQAETEAERYKLEQARGGDQARSKMSALLDELQYRTGRGGSGPMEPMAPVVEPAPYEGPAAAPTSRADENALMRAAAARAQVDALGAGADNKQVTPIMQAFMLSLGDDNEIVRTNSALEGKYLGDNQAPSLAAQRDKIEDEQRQEAELADLEARTKKYGFDLDYKAKVYNTDVDAGTARRGQDISASTARRGQDMTDARVRANAAGGGGQTQTIVQEYPATKGTPAKKKFMGLFGEEAPAKPGRPKTRVTTVRKSGGASPPRTPQADPLGIR